MHLESALIHDFLLFWHYKNPTKIIARVEHGIWSKMNSYYQALSSQNKSSKPIKYIVKKLYQTIQALTDFSQETPKVGRDYVDDDFNHDPLGWTIFGA